MLDKIKTDPASLILDPRSWIEAKNISGPGYGSKKVLLKVIVQLRASCFQRRYQLPCLSTSLELREVRSCL